MLLLVLAVGVTLAGVALLPEQQPTRRAQPSAGPATTPPTDPPAPESSAPITPTAADRGTADEADAPARPPRTRAPSIEAANRVDGLIGAGLGAGEIRDDVGLDLRNELRNLTVAVSSGRDELAPPVARLREKVAVRLGEGGISPAYASRLDAAIAELGAAGV